MNPNRYLFDSKVRSTDGMISVSQLQTFLSCPKKWSYNYIENLTPRVERPYLTIGKLCHKGMQAAMIAAWKDQQNNLCTDYYSTGKWLTWSQQGLSAMEREYTEYMEVTPLLTEEIPTFEQILIDAQAVFIQAFEEFEPWKYEVITFDINGKKMPALELHFVVPCPPTKGMHGYIDAILKDINSGFDFVWCVDYKFRKSLAPNEDESYNIQNSVYAYACNKLGVDITGTMTWQHVNTPAAIPQILKNGTVSRAKIKTTWEKYAKTVIQIGDNPSDYQEEMKPKLADIEWYRKTCEYRNQDTIERIWQDCITPVAKKIKAAHGEKTTNYRSLYPWNCKMCQYQSLCQAELRNYDAQYIRQNDYIRRIPRSVSPLPDVELNDE